MADRTQKRKCFLKKKKQRCCYVGSQKALLVTLYEKKKRNETFKDTEYSRNPWVNKCNSNICELKQTQSKTSISQNNYYTNSVPINCAESYEYLGLHMIPSLSWTSHTESIYSNASRTRGYLRRNLKNASPEVGKTSPHNVHSTEIGVFNICLASITVLPHH